MKKVFLIIKKMFTSSSYRTEKKKAMDKRKLENLLRDQGYSRNQAKRLVSDMKSGKLSN